MLSESTSSLTAAPHESDEAFALRLQAEELGMPAHSSRNHRTSPSSSSASSASSSSSSSHGDTSGDGSSTPLLRQERRLLRVAADVGRGVVGGSSSSHGRGGGAAEGEGARGGQANPTVVRARLDEVAGTRISLIIIAVVNIPQILAGAIVLPLGWDAGDRYCIEEVYNNWKYWVLISTVRMALFTALSVVSYYARDWLSTREDLSMRITSLRNFTDASGLVWFVIGNMWFFGDNNICHDARGSPIFVTGVVMIVMNYIQICLPCVLALLLIPLFCCCMPCVIRVLARLQDMRSPKGASEAALAALPEVEVTADSACVNTACPICLSDMLVGEKARELTCKHAFHKDCVDEWLRVNATCPTCRTSILQDGNVAAGSGSAGAASPESSRSREAGEEAGSIELAAPPTPLASSSILTSLSGRPAGRVLVPTSDHGADSLV